MPPLAGQGLAGMESLDGAARAIGTIFSAAHPMLILN